MPRVAHSVSYVILTVISEVGTINISRFPIGKVRFRNDNLPKVFWQILTEYLLFAMDEQIVTHTHIITDCDNGQEDNIGGTVRVYERQQRPAMCPDLQATRLLSHGEQYKMQKYMFSIIVALVS